MRLLTGRLRKMLCLLVSIALAAIVLPSAAFAEQLDEGNTPTARDASSQDGVKVVQAALGNSHSTALLSDGSLWQWGDGVWIVSSSVPVKTMDDVESVSVGYVHCAVIKADGSLWMWGSNGGGQLGNGTVNGSDPFMVMEEVSQVSLGNEHSAAITDDGSLWMWGSNEYGRLGDGTETDRYAPVKVMDDVVSVSLGEYHSAAIKTDGSLWMWGSNSSGQLGDGTETDRYAPVKVMDDVVSVSLGSYCSAVIKADGSLWSWGSDSLHYDTDSYTPIKVMDDVVSVSQGTWHSAAIKSDGSLWTWGLNDKGELGDGTRTMRGAPTKVMDDVVSVSLGQERSAAIKSDGSLWMWGANDHCELGDGTTEARYSPTCIFRDGEWLYGGGSVVIDDEDDFVLGRDNNSFAHSRNQDSIPAAGFLNVSNYELETPYLFELYRRADKGERSAIRAKLHKEWHGSCYGIATSMAMVYEGHASLTDLATTYASSYYELGYPCDDEVLLNNIQYYQLSQFIDSGANRIALLVNENTLKQTTGTRPGDTLQGFLEKLVSGFRKHHTLLFIYLYGSSGHTILITDCNYDSAEDRYELTVYDENCIHNMGDLGSFGTMYVASDFSSFTYVNYKGEVVFTEEDFSQSDYYKSMSVIDPARLEYLVPDPWFWQSEVWTSEYLPPDAYEIDELGRVRIRFPTGARFTISNLAGEKLTSDGGTLSGDMCIYDIAFESGDDDAAGASYTIEVDSSEAFEVSGIVGEVDISAYDAENYLSVGGDGISGISMTLGQGSVISGEDYSFNAFASTEEEVRPGESGLISVSGQATGDVAISSSGDTVTATSDEEMRSVVTASYAGVDRTQDTVGDTKVAEMRAERVTAPDDPADDGDGNDGKDDKDSGGKPPVTKKSGIAVGQTAQASGNTYKATGASTVAFVKAKNAKSVTVPATVSLNGKTYSVTSIAKNSFKGSKIRKVTIGKNVSKIAKGAFGKSKVKTVVVKSKKLKKASSVKGSFAGAKAKKVTVKYGKLGKKYVKKSFTAKNTKAKKMVVTK